MGIVSFGDGCGKAESPGVYSNVSLFFEWIRGIVDKYSEP
ncbi:UNVERIFIED_CONTAM: hypothetical protein GTU68_046465 [Idotea baltica]|nr:hypothetical protein [Idotea baltica]